MSAPGAESRPGGVDPSRVARAGRFERAYPSERQSKITYEFEGPVRSGRQFVAKPPGELHTFWDAGSEERRVLEVIAPGEFAGYFDEVAATLLDGPPDEATMQRLGEIAAADDLDRAPECLPASMTEHGVGPKPGPPAVARRVGRSSTGKR